MSRLVEALKAVALIAFSGLCVAAVLLLVEAHALQSKMLAALAQLSDPKTGTIHLLNDDAVRTRDLLTHVNMTADAARKASAKESAYLDQWNASLAETLANVNGVLASSRQTVEDAGADEALVVRSAQETLTSVQGAIKGLKPVEDNAATELSALTQTTNALTRSTKDLDARIADANVAKIVANFQVASDNAAVISTAGRKVVEKYALPSKKKMGFWGTIWAAAQVVHKLSPPLF